MRANYNITSKNNNSSSISSIFNNKHDDQSNNYINTYSSGSKRGSNMAYADKLVQSEYGITTDIDAVEREKRPHLHPQREQRGKEMEQRGKRHFDPHHVNLSDEAKREEGRYGRRHVQNISQGNGDSGFNLFNDAGAQQPPARPLTDTRNQTTSTSMQLSEARARKIAEDPRYLQAAREVLRHAGDPAIVGAEERLTRRVAAAAYAAGSGPRCAELREEAQHRPVDLGPPAAAIQARVPFALSDSTPRGDSRLEHRAAHYRNAESLAKEKKKLAEEEERIARRRGGRAAHMRDNVLLSQNEYPDPPAVGVRVPPRVAPRPNSAQQRSGLCLDEEMMKRSRARCYQSAQQRMPDFIFGQPPPPEVPRQTLRGVTEERWKAQEDRTLQRRTGRAMTHQSHKHTALW